MSWRISSYQALAGAIFAAASPWLKKKYRGRGIEERQGYYDASLISMLKRRGRPLWIHSVSVGEVQSASSLIRLAKKDIGKRPLIMSTITPTGRDMAEQILAPYLDRLLYYPWDSPFILSRSISAIQPRLYATVETEVWPGMLAELKSRRIPSFMVNGRFSDRSFKKMSRFHGFWSDVLNLYTCMMVRSDDDRSKLISLGVDNARIVVTGDCKVDSLLQRREDTDLSVWDELIGENSGPVILAGSTHPGEDEIVLDAFERVLIHHPSARLILVPRHPERAESLLEIAGKTGRSCLLSDLSDDWKTVIVDRIGVLFSLYGISDCAFIGGSIAPRGGQNIMEPASFGVPLCQGPNFDDFVEATGQLTERGICTQISDARSMAETFIRDLREDRRSEVKSQCESYFANLDSSAAKTWHILGKYT